MTSGISRRESGPDFFFFGERQVAVKYDRRVLGGTWRAVIGRRPLGGGLCYGDDSGYLAEKPDRRTAVPTRRDATLI